MNIAYPGSSPRMHQYSVHSQSKQFAPQFTASIDKTALKFSGQVELPENIKAIIESACPPSSALASTDARQSAQETFDQWVSFHTAGKVDVEAKKLRADTYKAARKHAKDYSKQKGYDPMPIEEIFHQPSTRKAKLSQRHSAKRESAIKSAERVLSSESLSNNAGALKLALDGIKNVMDDIDHQRESRLQNPFSQQARSAPKRWIAVRDGIKDASQTAKCWEQQELEQKVTTPKDVLDHLKYLLREGLKEVQSIHRSKSARSITSSISKKRESLSQVHSQGDLQSFGNSFQVFHDIDYDEQANLRWQKFEGDSQYLPGLGRPSRPNLDLAGLQTRSDWELPKPGSGEVSPFPELLLTPSPDISRKRKITRTDSHDSTASKESTDELVSALTTKLAQLDPDGDEFKQTKRLKAKLEKYRHLQ
jgi:hypothetical protein